MREGFTLTRVQCDGCKQAFAMQPNYARDLDDVVKLAEATHKQSGVICPQTLLMMLYVPVLVTPALAERFDAMYEEVAATEGRLIVPNSNGAMH